MVGVCGIYGRWKTCNMNENRRCTLATQHGIRREFISGREEIDKRNDKQQEMQM
jgi:hypothetical protein